MARYSAVLGRRVEVQYRAGDILLPASGILVADSGRSIFLEQHLEQRGQQKYFRWEIPYQYIVRLEEKPEPASPPQQQKAGTSPDAKAAGSSRSLSQGPGSNSSADAAEAAGGASSLLPLSHRPKTA
jgi:hypothetical protein